MGDNEAAWLSWRPPPAGETPPGRSRAILRASSANVPCCASGRVQTRRAVCKVKTVSLAPPTGSVPSPPVPPFPPPRARLLLPLPGGRATALGYPLLVYLLRTEALRRGGKRKKKNNTRRNNPSPQDHTATPRSQFNMSMRHQRRKSETREKKIESNSRRSGFAAQENASWRAERRRCDGRWGSQREQTERLHPKPRLCSPA